MHYLLVTCDSSVINNHQVPSNLVVKKLVSQSNRENDLKKVFDKYGVETLNQKRDILNDFPFCFL
jgi:hypothetical protein